MKANYEVLSKDTKQNGIPVTANELENLIIIGKNGSGKTTLLKYWLNNPRVKNTPEFVIYLPINRVFSYQIFSSNDYLDNENIAYDKKLEDLSNMYSKEEYIYNCNVEMQSGLYERNFDSRNKRAIQFCNEAMLDPLKELLCDIFKVNQYEFSYDMNGWSDGYKSVYSILCNIFETIKFESKKKSYSLEELLLYAKNLRATVMVDEIEAYVHQYIQINLINKLGDLERQPFSRQ